MKELLLLVLKGFVPFFSAASSALYTKGREGKSS
jgi:hypothetical protein